MKLDGVEIRYVTRADAAAIQAVFATDPHYFERVDRAPLRPDEGEKLFDEPPPGSDQRVAIARRDGLDVAVLDFLVGYPEPMIWYLGLVFLVPAVRGSGLGTRLVGALGDAARQAGAHARAAT